jgi:hypothetical protein
MSLKDLDFLFRFWLVLLVGAGPLLAQFETPAEGPVPFRRDRLPLSGEAMNRLSRTLEQLGGMADLQTAAGRRGLAQILALAVAVDPGNRGARQQLEGAGEGRVPVPGPAPANSRPALDWCWQVVAWLDSPEAGNDGHGLAACLKDVLAPLDPGHPGAAVTLKSGEGGSWRGWVPALTAYQAGSGGQASPALPAAVPETPAGPANTAAPRVLTEAKIGTVLWTQDEAGRYSLAPVPVKMTLQTVESPEGQKSSDRPFFFSIANTERDKDLTDMAALVTGLLQTRHPENYPSNLRAVLACGADRDYLTGRNGDSISAGAAVLMNAAITGTAPEAIILGVLAEDGSFRLPARFWEKLRVLRAAPGNGARLVVPAEAADMLASILAIEEPMFFMKYEVLLASNLDELITRSSSEPLAASLMFHALKTSGGDTLLSGSVGLLGHIAKTPVRQRLAEISSLAPYHASARLLALLAAGERPTRLPRQLLALELLRALEPVALLAWPPPEGGMSPERAYQASRAELDGLDRYVDIRDRDLPTRARELATAARTFGRRASGATDGGAARRTFEAVRKEVLADLRAASTGMTEPER